MSLIIIMYRMVLMRVFQRTNRDNWWWIDYTDPNGIRHREKVGPSKAMAEDALAKIRTAIVENRYFDIKKQEEKVLFDDFVNMFIELHATPNKRPRVVRRDRGLIKRLSMSFSGKSLSDITPPMVERYKAERSKEVAPATVNRELACLKTMFNKAILWNKATDNPVRKVKLFKENNQRKRYLEKEEIVRFIDACQPHLKPIVIVAIYTGMRKSEILNLKWKDVDFEHGIIYLIETKNGERREVLMNEVVKDTLSKVQHRGRIPYIFIGKDNKPYTNVRKSFDAALKKCDIIDFKFHDLRHTFCSQLVMAGVDIKTVQELVGHKTPEMTHRYAHLSPTHKRSAIELLAQKIGTNLAPEGNSKEIEPKQAICVVA